MTLRRLLAQLGTTLLVVALCHAALLVVSLWLAPPARQVDAIDRRGLYRGAFGAAVFGALEADYADDPQVVIVGSSNALLGFRPAEIAPLLPGTRVHNLSTASMRMDEIRHMVELVWSVLPPAQRARTTFVVTLVFASFPPPGSLYLRRQAGVMEEIRRSAVFDDSGGGIEPRVPRAAVEAAILLRRPLALLEAVADEVSARTWGLQQLVSTLLYGHTLDVALLHRSRPDEELLFPRADSEHNRQTNVSFFLAALKSDTGGLGAAQFAELARLCRWARERRANLVLVGMPVPKWLRDALPYVGEYERELRHVLDEVGGTVRFVDLSDAALPMWDSTHPDPAQTSAWAAHLAAALREPKTASDR
ncbi:hypothetical protein K2Z84_29010 [Candidatus Binatia bacterium]|nr:hypothetical protein [Candidatus Binatia bacterium]